MVVKYSKIFTTIYRSDNNPVTILVKSFKPGDGETLVRIRTLEGEFATQEEFKEASHSQLRSSIMLMIPDARQLVDALNEALEASEEG